MQADRGFTLSHQKVALELGFSGVLAGFTELTIVPSNAALRHIYLHARCMDIQRVLCNGQEVRFEHTDAVKSLALSDIHGHAQLSATCFLRRVRALRVNCASRYQTICVQSAYPLAQKETQMVKSFL